MVQPALRVSLGLQTTLCMVYAKTLLLVEANLRIKCSGFGLAWVRKTKKRSCFVVKPHRTHSFEAILVSPAIVQIRHILPFVVTKFDVKELLSQLLFMALTELEGR